MAQKAIYHITCSLFPWRMYILLLGFVWLSYEYYLPSFGFTIIFNLNFKRSNLSPSYSALVRFDCILNLSLWFTWKLEFTENELSFSVFSKNVEKVTKLVIFKTEISWINTNVCEEKYWIKKNASQILATYLCC